jgi:TPR repeat protein
MRRRISTQRLLRSLAGSALLLCSLAHADDAPPPFDLAHAQEITAAMQGDPALANEVAACPADIYRQAAPFWERWFGWRLDKRETTTQQCEQHPDQCYEFCAESGYARYCFHLALALQAHEEQIAPRFSQMMFARACALGYSSGCTNRGAHMRNRDNIDIAAKMDKAAQDLCQFRSFKIDCDSDGPWGCAMLGQAYHYGEGVGRDAASARKYYEKSCALAPDFVSCDFSKDALKEMSAK